MSEPHQPNDSLDFRPEARFIEPRALADDHRRRMLAWLVLFALVAQTSLLMLGPVLKADTEAGWSNAVTGLAFWMALTPALIRLLTAPPLPRTQAHSSLLDWIVMVIAAIGVSWLVNSAAAAAFLLTCAPAAMVFHESGRRNGLPVAVVVGSLAAILALGGGAYLAVALLIRRRG